MADTVDPKAKKAADDLTSSVDKLSKSIETLNRSLKTTSTSAKKTFKGIGDDLDENTEQLKDANDNLQGMWKNLKKLSSSKAIDPVKAKKYHEEMKRIEAITKRLAQKSGKGVVRSLEKRKELTDDVLQSTKRLSKLVQPSAGARAKSIFGDPKAYEGFFKGISAAPDALSVMGSVAKGAMGTFGKMTGLIGGWPLAIAAGVKALWDMGMAADEFMKNANKAFQEVRGPDIMTQDVKKQFKDFNDQIYNAGQNIKVGLNADEIRGFMLAMHQAGVNVSNLNSGLTSYRDAVYVAAKASKTLGLSLPEVASAMGEMSTNFRLDLGQMDKAFVQVAFDAKKSGLSTDRFWATVQNANASLAMYGVNISAASKTMARFTKDAIGGADGASKAVEDMYNVFKSGGIAKPAILFDMAIQGGAKLGDMIGKKIAERRDKEKALQGEIASLQAAPKTEENTAKLAELNAQLVQQQVEANDLMKAQTLANKGNTVDLASYMQYFAEDAPEIIAAAMKGTIGGAATDLGKLNANQTTIVVKKISELLGVNEETAQMILRGVKTTQQNTRNTLPLFKSIKKSDALMAKLDKVGKTQGNEQIKAAEDISTILQRDSGIAKVQADLIANMAKTDPQAAKLIANYIEAGNSGDEKAAEEARVAMENLLTSVGFQTKLDKNQYKQSDKTEDELKKLSEKAFEKSVEQTLSFKEMQKIATDEIQYRVNSLGALQSLNGLVAGIYKKIDKRGYEGFKTSAQQAVSGGGAAGTGNVLNQGATGIINAIDAEQSALNQISKDIELGTNVQTALNDALEKAAADNNQELVNKLVNLGNTIVGETSEDAKKSKIAENIKKTTELNAKNKKIKEDIQKSTSSIDENGKYSADALDMMVKSNPETQKYIADQIAKEMKGGASAEKALKTVMGSAADPMFAAQALESQEMGGYGLQMRMLANRPTKRKANLRSPEMVSSPGMVKLDPGEMIIPKGYMDIKTLSVGPSAPLGKGPGSAPNINITISADTKDLAKQISIHAENAVRKVIYNDALTGMG